MITTNRIAGVAPEMYLRNALLTGDEAYASEGSTVDLKPATDVAQKSKTDISGSTKITNVLQNFLEKKNLTV